MLLFPSFSLRRLLIFTLMLLLIINFSALSPQAAHADGTFVVTKTADTNDGICNADCSLREAVGAANAAGGVTSITFSVNGTFTLNDVLLLTANPITITGNGAGNTIITRTDSNDAKFSVQPSAAVTINDLTVSGPGLGIYDTSSLTVTNSVLSNNMNNLAPGGAIFVTVGGHLTVINSSFSENTSVGTGGGAIYNDDTATIINSSFSNNSAVDTDGGAIVNAGTMTIINSAFSGNSVKNGDFNGGGGLASIALTAETTIINSVFSGNSIVNSTNVAGADNILALAGMVTLENTIVANSAAFGDCATLNNGVINAENSLIESGLACVNGTNTNNLTGDPALNGDLTLSAGSLAINAGSNSLLPADTYDLNNNSNTSETLPVDLAGNPRISGSSVDIGAYEFAIPGPDVSATKTVAGTFEVGGTVTYTVALTNNGTGDQPDNAGDEFSDTLPAQVTLDSGSASATSGSAAAAGNIVTWNGPIPAGDTVTITFVATVNSGTVGQTVSNQGTAFYDSDANGSNESSAQTDIASFVVVASGISVGIPQTAIPAVFFECSNLGSQTDGSMTASGGIGDVHSGDVTGNIYCHVIAKDETYVTSAAQIGNAAVINLGVVQAVDVFGELPGGSTIVPFDAPIQICLRGTGEVLFLDAATTSRTVTRLDAIQQGNSLCVSVPNAGTLVLVNGSSGLGEPPTPLPAAPQSIALTSCRVTTTHSPLNLRAEPETAAVVLAQLPYELTLTATERVPGWYRVIYLDKQGWVSDAYLSFAGDCGR